jgi:hypothetical protein
MATAKLEPAATAVHVVAVTTWVGVLLLVVVPFPSWPLPLPPHVHREPSELRAIVKLDPAAIGDVHACSGPPRISKTRSAAGKAYDFRSMMTPW